MSISVLLVDDHAMVRDGLRLLLEAEGDIRVVGDAGDGPTALEVATRLRPNVVIMDIAMPGTNGVEVTRQISDACPSCKVIVLSMYSTLEHVYQALRAGARGYVLKESAGAELVNAVRLVSTGHRYLSPRAADLVLDDYVQQREVLMEQGPLDRLSPRERQVLQLVVEGKTSAQIAEALFLSVKTVETYRSRLMEKLGVADVPSLVKFAIQHGLISL